jgi:hypothetical protein
MSFLVLLSPSSYPFDSIELRPSGLMLKACGCNSGSVAHHLARKHIDVISVQRRTPWLLFLVSLTLLGGGGYMYSTVNSEYHNYTTLQGSAIASIILGAPLLLMSLLSSCTTTMMIRTSSGGSFFRTSCTRPDEQEKLLAWLYGGEDGASREVVPAPQGQPPATFAYASGPGPAAYAAVAAQQPSAYAQYPGQAEAYARMS